MAGQKFKLLTEVAPARQAGTDIASASPVYELAGGRDIPDDLQGLATLHDLWQRSVTKYADNNCLGTRPDKGDYAFRSYKQVGEMIDGVASAMAATGMEKGSTAGVFGANSPEWMVAMQACNRMSYVCVPLYDTLGANAVEFIINHSETHVVFVHAPKMSALVKVLPNLKGLVKHIIYWGDASEDTLKDAADAKVTVVKFDDFLQSGLDNPKDPVPPQPDDLCTIMYTSGTTGDPKGVIIKHRNVLAEISSLQRYLISQGHRQDQTDIYLSFLPLAHIFDRVAEEFYLSIGATIGYWRGDAKGLTEDIASLKPTLFVGVPRVFERIQAGVMAKMAKAGCIAQTMFNWGMRHKKYYMDKGLPQDKASPLFDALVFGKIKAALGGRVQIIISGGAPLSKHVEDFLQVSMCAIVVQGYGLTETMAGAAISLPGTVGGTVGPPLPGVQLRLESSIELNYDALADPPRGEVLLNGDIVSSGYFNQKDKTDEVLEKDGWFHTGDIGEITPEGLLKIIDRKKNIFKLSQGEYIAVEKVEGVFGKCSMVEQIWVYGNSFHSALVAVVVPAEHAMMDWAKENGLSGDMAEVCSSDEAKKAVLADLNKTGRGGGLHGFEIPRAVHLEATPFDIDRDLITPTFKLKRPQLLKYYQSQVDEMYKSLGM